LKKLILICIIFFIALIVVYITNISNVSNAAKIDSIEIVAYEYTVDAGGMKPQVTKTWTLSEKDTIARFVKALNNRTKTNAKIDIRPRDYLVKILYKNKSSEEYDLWISKDAGVRGTLMQGNKVWFINKDSNSIFKDILK
jgi:hypothetical protein